MNKFDRRPSKEGDIYKKDSTKLRALSALVSYMPRTPHALVFYVPSPQCALVPYVLPRPMCLVP